jgi:hypothetical protein
MKRDMRLYAPRAHCAGKEKEAVLQALSQRARRDSNARPSVPEIRLHFAEKAG